MCLYANSHLTTGRAKVYNGTVSRVGFNILIYKFFLRYKA
jgi:hypothetical protein